MRHGQGAPPPDDLDGFKQINDTHGHGVGVGVGVVNYDHGRPSVDQVLADADHAMYAQKRQHRDSN